MNGPTRPIPAEITLVSASIAEQGALAVLRSFDAFLAEFQAVSRRARRRFAARDWAGGQADLRERLDVRERHLRALVDRLRQLLHGHAQDRGVWALMKPLFLSRVARRPDTELAETYYNSATRRVFSTMGVDPRLEFVASELKVPLPDPGQPSFRTITGGPAKEMLRRMLSECDLDAPFRDLDGDVLRGAERVQSFLGGRAPGAVDVLRPVFYRGKGAYLVGRMRLGAVDVPLVLALVHEDGGVSLDGVLLGEEQAALLFSFTRSPFLVACERPRAIVDFLRTVVPRSRLSELYGSLGFEKHAKTELYREIVSHLERSPDRFVPTRGERGKVMAVLTLPSLDTVFKVIRDAGRLPAGTTRAQVLRRYQDLARLDRAGRLPDVHEFENLSFARGRFDPRLLEELLDGCAETVSLAGDEVQVRHLYVERRVTPLDLFLRETGGESARRAVLDLGLALRDLAATGTFPGGVRLENFGVTRTGRVIFLDSADARPLADAEFQPAPLPAPALDGSLRQAFLDAHGEVLGAAFWRDVQERHRAGEILDVFPYERLGATPEGAP